MEPHRELDLSVCVVSYNAREPLERCLASLRTGKGGPSLEICVVDNHSRDGSADRVAGRFPAVRLIRNGHNLGFARAANQAMQGARGRYLLLCNPDVVVPAGTLEALFRIMEASPRTGLLGCRQTTPDGKTLGSCGRFPGTATILLRSLALDKILRRSNRLRRRFELDYFVFPETAGPVDCVIGAFVLARRTAVEDVGGLDEDFFLYGEDLDWCLRMRQHGWEVAYTPEVCVVHEQGASAGSNPVRSLWLFHVAMYKFYRKHQRQGIPFPLRWAVPAGIAGKLLLSLARHAAGTRPGQSIYRTTRNPEEPLAAFASHGYLDSEWLRSGVSRDTGSRKKQIRSVPANGKGRDEKRREDRS
jgi:GT2 family glycosyltransferase